jgi:hypothetical protein
MKIPRAEREIAFEELELKFLEFLNCLLTKMLRKVFKMKTEWWYRLIFCVTNVTALYFLYSMFDWKAAVTGFGMSIGGFTYGVLMTMLNQKGKYEISN